MSIQFEVESLDSVDASLKQYYKEADGKFRLDLDESFVSGLKSALQNERDEAKTLKQQLADWKKLGDSPTKALEVLKNVDNKEYLENLDKLINERDEAKQSAKTAQTRANQFIIKQQLTEALAKHGFTKTGIELLPDRHMHEVSLNDDMTLKFTDAENMDEYVGKLSDKYADLVTSSRKGGSGTPPGGGSNNSGKTMSRSSFNELSPSDQSNAIREGIRVVD